MPTPGAPKRLERLEADARLQPNNANKQAELYAELNKVDPWATVRRFESNQFVANDQCVREYLAALTRLQRLDRAVPFVSQGLGSTGGTGVGSSSSGASLHPGASATAGVNVAIDSAFAGEAAAASAPAGSHFGHPYSSMQGAAMGNVSFAPAGMRAQRTNPHAQRPAPQVQAAAHTPLPPLHTLPHLHAETSPGALAAPPLGALGASHSGTNADPIHVVMQEPGIRAQLWRAVRTLAIAFLVISGLNTLMEDRGMPKGMNMNSETEPNSSAQNYKFTDVQGVDEAKQELVEVVEYLRDPSKFTRLGGKLPKGILLTGPPGTGKTLLAKTIAGEAGVPFFYCSGSEFDEMFVGVGARRMRELFSTLGRRQGVLSVFEATTLGDAAKRKAPCIIFIDEIDAVGSARNPKDQQMVKMTLNQLLVEMDGFSSTEGVIVIGATNFPELLDKALVRPGRFDRHVTVPLPDVRGREQILRLHTKKVPLGADVNLGIVARGTPGFSGAELANLVNQAAVTASMEGKTEVSMAHLEYAKDKIIMGAERKSAVIEEANRRIVAFHEGGHAIVAIYTAGALPVHKATIMPRGSALGMVSQLPEKDELSWTKRQLLARLDVAMGGRVAEELIFGADEITSGASSDLDAATRVAYGMVTRFGMSDKVGPVAHHEEDMGRISGETKQAIDSEVRRLLDESRARATALLRAHQDELHRLASALVDYETLTREEIETVIHGLPLARPRVAPPKTADEAVPLAGMPVAVAPPPPSPPVPHVVQPRPQAVSTHV